MNKKFINNFIKAYTIYNEKFENKEFLYIYKENNNLKGISVEFSINNFTHLTGIKKYNNKNIIYELNNNKFSLENRKKII